MRRFSLLGSAQRRRYQEIAQVFLRHGFGFLFERLGSEWQPRGSFWSRAKPASSVAAQDLPSHFRQALEELGPTFVKLGQVLSTRPDLLPAPYITELSKLQDAVPPAPWEAVRDVLTQELGRAPEEVFATVDPEPMAAASLAQVHAATLSSGKEVVVKVQRPNILPTIKTDLEILQALAAAIQPTSWGQKHNPAAVAEEFASNLRDELNYRREGRNADRFRANFADEPVVHVPRVYWEHTTARVLVEERIQGIKLDDVAALDAAGYDRHQVVEHFARMVVKEVLVDGFFHADPHAGNFLVMPGEVIGAIDFGVVGCLRDNDRLEIIKLYAVAIDLDADAIVDQLIHIGAANAEVDRMALSRDIDRLLNRYYGLALTDYRFLEVAEALDPIIYKYDLRLPSYLALLGKTVTMLEGVALKVDPDFDVWAFSEPYLRKMSWRLALPHQDLSYELFRQGTEWADLIRTLPRVGNRLLARAEQGELIQIGPTDMEPILRQADRLTTRITLALLLAALTISLALLRTVGGGAIQAPVTAGYLVVTVLTAWLFISILRGTR